MSPIDSQMFSQIPVVTLFAVIMLKMLKEFKQYLKERDELQARVTKDLTDAIGEMSAQINRLAISLVETRTAARSAWQAGHKGNEKYG